MKVAGVTVLFNPDDDVINNINSYISDLDVLYLVDNTPDIDNSNIFKDKKIIYISNKKNNGIAYALNTAAKKAIKDGYQWLLTMDQDSCFKDDALRKMINYINEYKPDEYNGLELNRIGIISPLHRIPQNKNGVFHGVDKPLLVMTSGNLVNLDAYTKVDGFKDWMFIDAVDFDFCLNLRKNGFEILQLNECELNHELGETFEKHIGKTNFFVSNHSAFRYYFIVRNRHYIFDMYKDDFPDFCNAELKRTKPELFKVIFYEKHKIKKCWEMFRGYIDYKKGVKGGFHGK